ncbi:MAG: rod shape-determining protein [Geodermatophilales bacterium]|nr:rod shape-determining protein [Geodermatophilales bacterium]
MELGIDLGTANTVVSDIRRGIVFDEPSVMLLRRGGGRRERVLAVGQDAADLLGRAPSTFVPVRPLHDGVVTDLETARLYLRSVLHKAGRRGWGFPVRAVIGVPVGSTALEHRALLEAAEEAGIRPVTALDEAIAGAVGCGIDPLERRVHMVVDVGGGTAERWPSPGTSASSTSCTSVNSRRRTSRSVLRPRRTARWSCRAATVSPAGRGWPRCRRPRWPTPSGRSPTRSSGRSPHAWTTSPRRRSPTCSRRACWCSAGPRRSRASPRSWSGVWAFRSSSPRSP